MTLEQIIERANRNELIVPSFQRGFKWKSENIRKLLESIVLDYPIGSVLLWQTPDPILEYRPLHSIPLSLDDETENPDGEPLSSEDLRIYQYILDGQQRLTSIYKIFVVGINKIEKEAILDNKSIFRFFLDLNKLKYPQLTHTNIQNYVVQFPSDVDEIADACIVKSFEAIRKEYRIRFGIAPHELEEANLITMYYEKKLLPLTFSFLRGNTTIIDNWIDEDKFRFTQSLQGNVTDVGRYRQMLNDVFNNWKSEFATIQTRISQKNVHSITLQRDSSYEGLARIFETINSTGQSLTTFDLLVAKMSTWEDNQNIRKLILSNIEESNLKKFDDGKNLGGVACQQLPRIFAIKTPRNNGDEISLKKSEILRLDRNKLIQVALDVCISLNKALLFLKNVLGVHNSSFFPFKDAITLASTINNFENPDEIRLFECFYWKTVFTEDLEKDSNSKTKELYLEWIGLREGNHEISTLREKITNGFPSFEDFLQITNTSATRYNAFVTYVFKESTIDWTNNDVKALEKLEDHHIFPTALFRNTITLTDPNIKNSVLNRVLVSKGANGNEGAGNRVPSIYLRDFNNMDAFFIPTEFRDSPVPNTERAFLDMLRIRYEKVRDSLFAKVADL